jgi:ribosome-associated protein
MSGPLVVRGIEIPETELSWRFSRSGGPGGQSVNTSDSRVELSYDVAGSAALSEQQRRRALGRLSHRLTRGVLTIAASEYRSQHRNREAARARLVDVLSDALEPPPPRRRPTKPSRRSRERRLAGKRRRSEVKSLRRRPTE